MFGHAKQFVIAVVTVAATLVPAVPALAKDPWKIELECVEQGPPGWYRVRAWGTNVSGYDLEACTVQLTVLRGNASIEEHSKGAISLGDTRNGETRYYEFDLYSKDGDFEYQVRFRGLVPRRR